jgi:hypothetical protein
MEKITKLLTTAALVMTAIACASNPVFADQQFDNFRKNQEAQYEGDRAPENCREKNIKKGDYSYQLCQHKGKPIYIRVVVDDTPISFYGYKNGKLVQSCSIDAFICHGYKNNRLVVIWNMENQTVNYKVSSPDNRQIEKSTLAESKKILKLFGFNSN